ncbi:MAG TPA: hypothetical protein VGO00_08160 [Kofleriaceae bacterium]|jgi:uncharacterized membrane protein YqjE|nr:hypothetical protein [Kofleriaceae bacterium]
MAQNLNNASVLLAAMTLVSLFLLVFLIFFASGAGLSAGMASVAAFGAGSAIGLGISARPS